MNQFQSFAGLITFILITRATKIHGDSGESQCDSSKNCVTFTSCDTLNGKTVTRICGWNGMEKMICCPVMKLETIVNNTSECGTFNNNRKIEGVRRMKRVVGGHDAKRGSWPWMAAIFNQAIPSRKMPFCAGTLISTSSVLTTASTFIQTETITFVVVLGDLKLGDDSDRLTPIEVEVSRIVIHENFMYPQSYNDIAIVKLKTAVTFTRNIRMICLPGLDLRNGNVNLDGKNATIAGWGHNTFDGSYPPDLQEAIVPIVANSQCDKAYKSIAGFENAIARGITKDIICAGGDKKYSCQGDSGGPLAYNHKNTKVWILVGIISSGFKCGREIPGIYTRVSEYMDWIGLHI